MEETIFILMSEFSYKNFWGGGGQRWTGSRVSRCKLFYLEWINNKVLLYSMGNYTQSPGINHNGKEYKKRKQMCV